MWLINLTNKGTTMKFAIEIKSDNEKTSTYLTKEVIRLLNERHVSKEQTESRLDIFCLEIANLLDLIYAPYFDRDQYILRFNAE